MADSTDITKRRPELMEKSVNELERMKTEIQMAIQKKAEEEMAAQRVKLIEEAKDHIDNVLTGLKWLEANSFLNESVKDFFTTKGEGRPASFAPHLKFKAPKA